LASPQLNGHSLRQIRPVQMVSFRHVLLYPHPQNSAISNCNWYDSLEGIAAALGCSVGTVKSRLFHALDKLRKMNAFSTQRSDFEKKGGVL
jgi:hypothetical protein